MGDEQLICPWCGEPVSEDDLHVVDIYGDMMHLWCAAEEDDAKEFI